MREEEYLFEISLNIGKEPVKIRSDNPAFIQQAGEKYANFITSSVHSCLTIHAEIDQSGDSYPTVSLPMDHPDVQCDHSTGEWFLSWNGLQGRYNMKTNTGRMQNGINPLGLNSFLRFVFSLLLVHKNGGLVHASSLIKDGQAYLFPGKSGAGKTTITRLSPESEMLADDVSLVRCSGRGCMAFGTPFSGSGNPSGENRAATLRGIYFPVKDQTNYLQKLQPARALQRLLPNAVSFARDRDLSQRLFHFCADFVSRIPAYDLHFLPESSFWRCLDAG